MVRLRHILINPTFPILFSFNIKKIFILFLQNVKLKKINQNKKKKPMKKSMRKLNPIYGLRVITKVLSQTNIGMKNVEFTTEKYLWAI